MVHEPEKSDAVIVAVKPKNKAGRPAAEPVEPRTATKGNAGQQSTRRARTGKACHRRWNAYGQPQGTGRRRSLPRSCTYRSLMLVRPFTAQARRGGRHGRDDVAGLRA